MQVARYWRMKTQTYRLQGTRLADGSVSIQDRPTAEHKTETTETRVAVKA
jgi:hypothetical protein